MRSEIEIMLDRIANWQRFYRQVQRIHAVPWYTPPILGEVHEQEIVIKIAPDMRDAILLEKAWRNMDCEPKKWFIKYEYISKLPHQVIWRKIRKLGDRIKNQDEHMIYTRSALEYFKRNIDNA